MGKNSGWFRRLFAGKLSKNLPAAESYGGSDSKQSKSKKKWRILGSGSAGEVTATPEKEVETRVSWTEPPAGQSDYQTDASKHAIAVAAAAAAVAEAAVAAAQAAAEVVLLTNRGGRRLDVAAVIIQSAFRGYLAKRALKALKALVKLQALVRGHIVRKQTADMLRRMQALARVQARARASRARAILDSSHSTRRLSQPHHMRWGSNPNISDIKTQPDSSWLEQWMEECSWINNKIRRDSSLQTGYSHHHEDEITHKILEVDSWKPQESMSGRVQSSLSLLRFPFESETVYTADNSPQVCPSLTRPGSSSSSRRRSTTATTATANALTPRSTDCSPNFFSDHPKYMKKTESSQAKMRSQSAPRMRLQFQKQASSKRSFHGCWDPSSSPNKSIVKNGRPASTLDKVGNSTRFR